MKKEVVKETTKTKSAKEASGIFHNIMAASVKGNPKPIKKGNYSLLVEEMELPLRLKLYLKRMASIH